MKAHKEREKEEETNCYYYYYSSSIMPKRTRKIDIFQLCSATRERERGRAKARSHQPEPTPSFPTPLLACARHRHPSLSQATMQDSIRLSALHNKCLFIIYEIHPPPALAVAKAVELAIIRVSASLSLLLCLCVSSFIAAVLVVQVHCSSDAFDAMFYSPLFSQSLCLFCSVRRVLCCEQQKKAVET